MAKHKKPVNGTRTDEGSVVAYTGPETGIFEPYEVKVVKRGATIDLRGGTMTQGVERDINQMRDDAVSVLRWRLGDDFEGKLSEVMMGRTYLATGHDPSAHLGIKPTAFQVKLRKQLPEPADMQQLLEAARVFGESQTLLRTFHKLAASGTTQTEEFGGLADLVMGAIHLGQLWQRMKLRPLEPATRHGQRVVNGAAAGKKAKAAATKAKAMELYRGYLKAGKNKTEAMGAVVEELGISLSAVKAYRREDEAKK